jgi:hypothetical protein
MSVTAVSGELVEIVRLCSTEAAAVAAAALAGRPPLGATELSRN